MKARRFLCYLVPRLAVAVVAILVSDAIAAKVLLKSSRTPHSSAKDLTPPYGHSFKPNQDIAAAVWGHRRYKLRTNSLGFRDALVRDVPLKPTRYRILFLGDSFTMGIGVDYEETFAGRLADALTDEGVEILNAGVDNYATGHYASKLAYLLDEVGLEIDEVFCCIDMSDILEDIYLAQHDKQPAQATEVPQVSPRSEHAPRPTHWPAFRRRLRQRSLIVDALYRIKLHVAPQLPLNETCAMWSSDDEAFKRYGQKGMQIAQRNMDHLLSTTRNHGLPLTIAVYPWPDQIARRDVESRQVRMWRRWASERGVAFVNAFPAFMDAAKSGNMWDFFIKGDAHWNAKGHAIMAAVLLDHMKAGGFEASRHAIEKPNG